MKILATRRAESPLFDLLKDNLPLCGRQKRSGSVANKNLR